ncbi:MAG: hypothetical protein K2X27_17160 [Candidatus Obscuribacterales bacterium]|nr:hypothetical protein [Candidatus Obscuribacterales bacterium]
MQSSFLDADQMSVSSQDSYFEWLTQNFPLLSAENLEQAYGRDRLKEIADAQTEALPEGDEGRILIFVDPSSPRYLKLKEEALEQFAELCRAASADGEFAREARQFLSYLVLCDGYPAFTEMRLELADRGATLIRELMKNEEMRADLHSTVSGLIAYSQHARPELRLLMLDAFSEYLSPNSKSRPGRRELSTVLFDALNLELRRQPDEMSQEFQRRLIELMVQYPHPSLPALLTVLYEEHPDQALRRKAKDYLAVLQSSLERLWEASNPDQVSSLEFRARSLGELANPAYTDNEIAQGIFNCCKGLEISNLSDPRLPELNALLNSDSNTIRMAAAIALSHVYRIEPACQIAGKAIEILADTAINGKLGDFVLDAISGVKSFEEMSESTKKKVETANAAANQKFIFQNVKAQD